MAAPTGQADTSHLRVFEDMIIKMSPKVRAKFIDDYLDWMHEKAWNLGTAPDKEKTARLTKLVDIFILGKKEPDQRLLEEIQEAATILVYVIGDVGDEPSLVRLDRAQKRRVKLLNVWRAFMGVEPMPLPKIPALEPVALKPAELVSEAPKLEDYTLEDMETPKEQPADEDNLEDKVDDKGQG